MAEPTRAPSQRQWLSPASPVSDDGACAWQQTNDTWERGGHATALEGEEGVIMAPPAAQKREDRGRLPATQGKRGARIRMSERHAQSDDGVDLMRNGREACAVRRWRRSCASSESRGTRGPAQGAREVGRRPDQGWLPVAGMVAASGREGLASWGRRRASRWPPTAGGGDCLTA